MKIIKEKLKDNFLLFFFLITILFFIFTLNTAGQSDRGVETFSWLPYDQALAKSKIENIPTLIYFYAENCSWCRKLENETFTNEQVYQIMKNDFSLARVNSSSDSLLKNNGRSMTERQLSEQIYQVRGNPTVWFLDSKEERIAPLPGFAPAEDFIHILTYIKENHYEKYTFPEYMENITNK